MGGRGGGLRVRLRVSARVAGIRAPGAGWGPPPSCPWGRGRGGQLPRVPVGSRAGEQVHTIAAWQVSRLVQDCGRVCQRASASRARISGIARGARHLVSGADRAATTRAAAGRYTGEQVDVSKLSRACFRFRSRVSHRAAGACGTPSSPGRRRPRTRAIAHPLEADRPRTGGGRGGSAPPPLPAPRTGPSAGGGKRGGGGGRRGGAAVWLVGGERQGGWMAGRCVFGRRQHLEWLMVPGSHGLL